MRISTLFAALAITAVAVPAFAGTPDMKVRQIRVADLDLSSASGQAALRTRVARAIEAVCGSYATTAETSTQDEITACRAQVQGNVAHQIAARAVSTSALASAH